MDSSSSQEALKAQIEQNPIIGLAIFSLLILFTLLLTGFVISWGWLILQSVKGNKWLDVQAWKPRTWGFADLVVIAVLILVFQIQSVRIGADVLGIDRSTLRDGAIPIEIATALGLGNLAAMLASIAWISLRYTLPYPVHPAGSLSALGFRFDRFAKDLRIGVIAALAALPIVYGLMGIVSWFFHTNYKHPLLEELKRNGTLTSFLMTVLTAVIIAPLVEEFLFRVLIQGWLQSVPFKSLTAIFVGDLTGPVEVAASPAASQSLPTGAVAEAIAFSEDASTSDPGQAGGTDVTVMAPVWPSLVTGVLFGMAHFGYGYSFIPLIILGTLLGLLYRATQSIWPSLVVHMMLNGTSVYALGVAILVK